MATDAEVTAFLVREARLMDEHRYEEWLALWAPDGVYWIPCETEDYDPANMVSIVYDDYERLCQRVERLTSGTVQAQLPRPRMRRVIGNVEVTARDKHELTVESNFLLSVARPRGKELWSGRSMHRLYTETDSWTIARKKVVLVDLDQEIGLLQFLI